MPNLRHVTCDLDGRGRLQSASHIALSGRERLSVGQARTAHDTAASQCANSSSAPGAPAGWDHSSPVRMGDSLRQQRLCPPLFGCERRYCCFGAPPPARKGLSFTDRALPLSTGQFSRLGVSGSLIHQSCATSAAP